MPESSAALFLAYSCHLFVRGRNGETKRETLGDQGWDQDQGSRIKMRKLKRDGASVVFVLLSFALNRGG